ncbi:hypothetical protein Q8F55_004687 [Vanrija albida]|uniref:Uncharacterized protein n=1 Tax=Vanrija albida TaxID=181172 RepID=A0ABR3Q7M6_9TREE
MGRVSTLCLLVVLLATAANAYECSPDPYHDAAHDECNGFRYVPNRALNIIACGLYSLCGLIFILSTSRRHAPLTPDHLIFRGWYFFALTFGTGMMAGGIAIRVVYYDRLHWDAGYGGQQLLIILAPCLLIAANYVLLGRIAAHLDARRHMFIPPRAVSWIFVVSDIGTFFVQGGGGGLSSNKDPKLAHIGQKLLLAGLIAQLVSFAIFSALWLVFTLRVRRDDALWNHPGWKPLNYCLGVNCVCFLIRNTFRMIEFTQGWHGYLATHEVYWAVLEALPVLIAISLFTWFWPSRILTERRRPVSGEFIPLAPKPADRVELLSRGEADMSYRHGVY